MARKAAQKKEKVGSITHIFSHLHLTMQVYKVSLPANADFDGDAKNNREKEGGKKGNAEGEGEKNKNFGSKLGDKAPRRWASAEEVEAETMGTGMRNCWVALQAQQQQSTKAVGSKKRK